jgi:type IV pilus assembly protein PilY1
MSKSTLHSIKFSLSLLVTGLTILPTTGSPAPGTLATEPLFLSGTVKPNITLVIDDSGSMDSEVLFYSNDGALWWNIAEQSFISEGKVNFNIPGQANDEWKKYVYLFPNGTGSSQGRRVYGDSTHDHYAIPPLPQYAFARSPDYNDSYYNPDTIYTPWPSTDSVTYGDVDPTKAPADPIHISGSDSFFNLTQILRSNNTNHVFRMQTGMVIAKGSTYYDGSNWEPAPVDIPITEVNNYGIEYYPATYYKRTTTGTYQIIDSPDTINGQCNIPRPDHYTIFHGKPGSLSGVDALGPDGACLEKFVISATDTAQMQNFANWFSYYRKRHLGLRNGINTAFKDITGVRAGIVKINNRPEPPSTNMIDLDTSRNSFLSAIYAINGNSGGTPNRKALDYTGRNYMRTDNNAPIQYQCQKNFAIQFTDGFSTLEAPTIGNIDSNKGNPYADVYSNTLADIAMKYYTDNLRPSLPTGQVPIPGQCSVVDRDPSLDCNKNLHMNTLTVGLGVRGTIFGNTLDGKPYYKVADAYANPPTWPDVTGARDTRQVDDLYHAAVNGRGEIYNARNPRELSDSMSDALSSIVSSIGSAAALTFNTSQLTTGSRAYLSLFNSSNWSGDVLSYGINPENGQVFPQAYWSAANKLDNKATSERVIYTYNNVSNEGVNFAWTSLADSQKDDLRTTPPSPPNNVDIDSFAQARLDFLRGDRSNEGRKGYRFRSRSSVLGDIVHSAPVYVGPAALNLSAGDDYQTYVDSVKGRTPVLYVGANDGMLHGFRANDGEEVLAYIPSNLYSTTVEKGLHYLTNPAYRHRFYVDLEPVVFDAQLSGDWRTLLIGGLRAGGRGYFALDVTNPDDFTSSNANSIVKWEFTNQDDPDLGHSFNLPILAKMENDKWAVVFSNGYEDEGGSGTAKLFIAYLEGGLDGIWTIGTDYLKIDTGSGSPSDRNGLASPALIDLDGNGKVDRAYAGDLKGNMWVFDLSDGNDMKLAYRLFTTQSNQPITTEPLVVKHPGVGDTPANKPNVLVLFGTGQYMVDGDKTSTHTQSVYGVWDDGAATVKPLTLSQLVAQTVRTGRIDSSTNKFVDDVNGSLRLVTDNTVNYTAANDGNRKYGWYLNLPVSGERVVVDGTVRGKILFFNTMIPSNAACEYGGSGWLVSIDFVNGGSPDATPFDLNRDSNVDKKDMVKIGNNPNDTVAAVGEKIQGIPARSSFLSNYQYTPSSSTTQGDEISIREVEGLDANIVGRLSWRELWNR